MMRFALVMNGILLVVNLGFGLYLLSDGLLIGFLNIGVAGFIAFNLGVGVAHFRGARYNAKFEEATRAALERMRQSH